MPVPSLQDLALRLVAGRTAPQLYDDVALGKGPLPWDEARPDRPVHAYTSQRIAERLGPEVATGLGVAKEAVQGLLAPLMGRSPLGEHGFDPEDVKANLVGIRAARRPRLDPALEAFLAGADIR